MIDTVDEVGRAAAELGIDCDHVKGGTVAYARSAVQQRAAEEEVREARQFGVDTVDLLGTESVAAAGALGGVYDPNCARLHPGRLVRGLAASLERRGVRIAEGTTGTDYSACQVVTDRGTVSCDTVVLALEGWAPTFARTHRRTLPLYSLMIATEPLPDAVWDELRHPHGRTFTDFRRLLVYGQRTADNRFAFGGRGARYHWGSTVQDAQHRDRRRFAHLRRTLDDLFPAAGGAAVTHTWGDRSACRGTGTRPSGTTRSRDSPSRATTWGTDCRPPTWPGARWPT